MNIQEAIKSTTKQYPFIRRKAWSGIITHEKCRTPIKVLPTDSPSGCILYEDYRMCVKPHWRPNACDLTADDWEIVF